MSGTRRPITACGCRNTPARLALRAPRGLARLVGGFGRWVFDLEGEPLRQVSARREDPEVYLKLSRQRDARVRWRGMVAVPVLLLVIAVAAVLAVAKPNVRLLAAAAMVAGLGLAGRRVDKPLLDTAVLVPKVAKLTSDVVVRALSALGLAGINQALSRNPNAIGFAAPITRDGPGWRADIDLPYGVTAAEVIERRDKLASGLGRPLGCVWPEGDHEVSPSRLSLWVGDQDMATAKPAAWPLAKSGRVDLFKAFPFGTDPRGRPVTLELAETNVLIGSLPGAGKTAALRVIVLAAALDPRAELWTFELKGSGDLSAVEKVSARYASGFDDESIEATLLALRDLDKECARRAKQIKALPRSICPENKITPQLAARKDLRLHHLVCSVDECQNLFTHPEYGKEAGELAERVIKLGRALGIELLLATQRPDSKSLPTGVVRERRHPVLPAGDGPGRKRHDPRHVGLPERHPRDPVHQDATAVSATWSARARTRRSPAPTTSTTRPPSGSACAPAPPVKPPARSPGTPPANPSRPRRATRTRCSKTCSS